MQKNILNWKAVKLMKALGVDKAAEEAFEREKKAGCVHAGYAVFTANWMFYDSSWTSGLFPLKEIAAYQKDYAPMSDIPRFYVRLLFRDGSKFKLPCEFGHLDKITTVLSELCPQAKERPHGTYL